MTSSPSKFVKSFIALLITYILPHKVDKCKRLCLIKLKQKRKKVKMPLLTPEMKKALRRVQADKLLNKKDLAKYIGVSESTAKSITKDNEPQNVKNKVFNAVVSAIAKNC